MADKYWEITRIGKPPMLVSPSVGKQAFASWTAGDDIIVIGTKSFARSSVSSIEESDVRIADPLALPSGLDVGSAQRNPVLNQEGDAVMWNWYKKIDPVSPKAYADYFSKVNGYYALDKVGDGVVLAFRKPLETGVDIPRDIVACNESEVNRMNMIYKQRNGVQGE